MDLQELIKDSLKTEAAGILKTADSIDESILPLLGAVDTCPGKLVFSGVGKSGHVGKKLAATFASLGIGAIFVQSTESLHGDLGMIQKDDLVFLLSNSGSTHEVLAMLPNLKQIGCQTVAFTSKPASKLAQSCHYSLIYQYDKEADLLGLAPTTSSTTMLALGDSLAVAISAKRGFTKENFHLYHPGGALGSALESK